MILKSLIFLHRWVGIVLCLVFLLWFPSGIGMMYWGFPEVSAGDKLDHSPKLDPAKIMLSPTEAAEKIGIQANPTQVRLNSFDGRPVYRFTGGGGRGRGGGGEGGGGRGRGGGGRIIYADTGEEQTEVSSEMLDRLASAWAGKPIAEAKKISVEEVDQWTVAGQLKTLRPMFKYTWPDGQQVYLNGMTGEVVQYTTFWTRVAAHVSAIPHWVYYTPLRQNQPVWINFMIYSSLIGTVGAIIGMIVAVMMYSPKQKYRLAGQPTGVPYRGQKRWHWIIGMVFGIATVTWTFSGLMSLGPFPLMQRLTGQTPRNERQQPPQQQQQPPTQVAQQTPPALAAPEPTTTPEPALATPRGEETPRTPRRRATSPADPAPSAEPTLITPAGQAVGSPETQAAAQSQPTEGTPQAQGASQTEQGNNAVGDGAQNRGGGGGGRGRGGRGGRGGGRGGRGGRGGAGQVGAPSDGTPAVAGQVGGEEGGRGGAGRRRQDGAAAAGTAVAAANQDGRGQGGGGQGRGQGGGQGGGGGRGGGPQGIAGALRGRVRMADFADVQPRDLLAKVPDLDVREMEYTSFASTPLVAVSLSGGKTQLLSLDGKKIDGFDQKQVIDIVTNALPDPKKVEIRIVDQYDLYYFDRTRQRPLPVILALTHDADNTRYYVDPRSARVMTTYNDKNWVNRWLYTGLHSLNFPFLYNHRPLWDIVVISFMVGGTALCVTSLILAWRVLGRKLKRAIGPPNDVLSAEGSTAGT